MTRHFRIALVSGFGAVACLVVGSALGNVHSHVLHERVVGWATAGGFVVLGVSGVRSAADGVYRLITLGAGRPGGGPARVLLSLLGYIVVLLMTLGMLRVPLGHLLLGGAITGVIVGIAAQQALGNVFAGIVLLLARPFTVGLRIRVRAGALGGEFTGTVRDMNLTYVVLDTDQGTLHVPNSAMLAAAVGPALPGADGPAPEPLVLRRPSERLTRRLPLPGRGRTRQPDGDNTPNGSASDEAGDESEGEGEGEGRPD
jgi:small-conductance mechanosensitive channel